MEPVAYVQQNHFTDYGKFIREVMARGKTVSPRSHRTFELVGTSFTFPSNRMFKRPKFCEALGWAEVMQLVAGVFDPGVLVYAAPNADHSLFTPQMAYGPRVIYQYDSLLNRLSEDWDTREAVLIIGSGADGATSNQPCTMSLQFLYRFGRLDCIVNMRSQDLIKGLSYDSMMFGSLTQAIALELGFRPGNVTIQHGSAHVYHDDLSCMPTTYGVCQYKVLLPLLELQRESVEIMRHGDWKPTPLFIEKTQWVEVR